MKKTIVRKPVARRSDLVGIFLHTFEDGNVNWQGEIIGVDGDVCLVQLFSWIMGEPTIVVPIKKDVIYSDACKLYSCVEDMNFNYEKLEWRRKDRETQKIDFEPAGGAG